MSLRSTSEYTKYQLQQCMVDHGTMPFWLSLSFQSSRSKRKAKASRELESSAWKMFWQLVILTQWTQDGNTSSFITGYFMIFHMDIQNWYLRALEKVCTFGFCGWVAVGGVAISCANSFWLDTSNTSTSIAPPKKSKKNKNLPKKDMHSYTTPQGQNGTAPLRPGSAAPPVLQGVFFSPRGYPFSPSPAPPCREPTRHHMELRRAPAD